MSQLPAYGAIGLHIKGRRWSADLYLWRRGPWRFSWYWQDWSGHLETPMVIPFLGRVLIDVLWGLKQQQGNRSS